MRGGRGRGGNLWELQEKNAGDTQIYSKLGVKGNKGELESRLVVTELGIMHTLMITHEERSVHHSQ